MQRVSARGQGETWRDQSQGTSQLQGIGKGISGPGQTKGDALSAQRASVGMKKDSPIPHPPPAPARLTSSPSI